MVENLKPDIEEPESERENSIISLGEVACTTSEEGHTIVELEEKGPEFPSLDIGDQKVQEAKEDEENFIEVSHIDFIFGIDHWYLKILSRWYKSKT